MKGFLFNLFLIISWWSSHDRHTLMINWWLSYHDDHGIVMKLVIMRSWLSSWHHFGAILGFNWENFGSILGSSRAQRSSWELSYWKSIFRVRLTPFWRILEASWEGFWRYFCIFFGYRFCNRFPFAFKMIFHWFSHLPDKQKWANSMGGPAKIKLSSC